MAAISDINFKTGLINRCDRTFNPIATAITYLKMFAHLHPQHLNCMVGFISINYDRAAIAQLWNKEE
jgi:hypothetical protein